MGDAPVAIDLFSGVGGMSLGFKTAGFRVAAAFDSEQRHIDTFKVNFPATEAFVLDLGTATGSTIRELGKLGANDIDLVYGGPPCQGFSVGGRRDEADPRNQLLLDFARLVTDLRPRYFVAENVEGLLLGYGANILERFCTQIEAAGYQVVKPIQVLDSANFGVPQRRRRAIILGSREGQFPLEYPQNEPLRDTAGRAYYPKVRHAISDLPAIEAIEELFEVDGFSGKLGNKSLYARLLHEIFFPAGGVAHSSKLTGCLRTRHSKEVVNRFTRTKAGTSEPVSRYIRLNSNEVAPTLRAGTANDKGSHTAPRPIHPTLPRCITAREAARLHSFPDWFQFHESRWHAFRQIGNSVPPLLAYRVALSVLGKVRMPAQEAAHDYKIRNRTGRAS